MEAEVNEVKIEGLIPGRKGAWGLLKNPKCQPQVPRLAELKDEVYMPVACRLRVGGQAGRLSSIFRNREIYTITFD